MCRNILYNDDLKELEQGSPLRVQEHLFPKVLSFDKSRITPACAGTLLADVNSEYSPEDHPCVCRNIQVKTMNSREIEGSPLRVQEH